LNVGKKLWSCAIAKSPVDCHVMLAIMIVEWHQTYSHDNSGSHV
jgi:hypothetical protein